MWDLIEVCYSNSKKLEYYNKVKGKCFCFLLKEVLEKGPGITHLKQISKISSHPS
jgi:hypothetical protein